MRKQLEADVEFQQALAILYDQLGDVNRASEAMSRVQSYYALRHMNLPAAVALQNAWMLFNTNNDNSLYRALDQLDARRDLNQAQHQQVEALWATWSVRRAQAEMEKGNSQRGLSILDAALAQYPNNPSVRMAVAGGYARLGRAGEAMAIYKSAPPPTIWPRPKYGYGRRWPAIPPIRAYWPWLPATSRHAATARALLITGALLWLPCLPANRCRSTIVCPSIWG